GRHGRGLLRYLHAARSCTDHPNPLAGQVETLLRPKRGVMVRAGKIAQARQLRYVGLRTQAGAQHEIASPRDGAVAGTDSPAIVRRVELGLIHAPVETNIPTKVELLVDVM